MSRAVGVDDVEISRVEFLVNELNGLLNDAHLTKPSVTNNRSFLSTSKKGAIDAWACAWGPVDEKLRSIEYSLISRVLLYECDRTMKVLMSARNNVENNGKVFKTYTIKDTVLNKVLRMSPPDKVKESIAEVCEPYKASRKLYNIVNNMKQSDDSWREFRSEYQKFRVTSLTGDGYGLSDKEVCHVFSIRHSDREETILTASARSNNPPLSIIKIMLKEYREALSMVDCPKWGWIPMQYAIHHRTSADIVRALIPTEEDCKNFNILCQNDFINNPDYRGNTPLHCAVYYDAPLETIKVLKESCSESVLSVTDCWNHVPYESAIWHGRSADMIEEFFVPGVNGHDTFECVLENLIRTITDVEITDEEMDKGEYEEKPEHKPLNSDKRNSEFTTMDETKHYDMMRYDLPSIAARISKSDVLQKLVAERSVETTPTFIKIADLYNSICLVITYYLCARNALKGDDATSSTLIYLLSISVGYMALREATELLMSHVRYFISIWNYFEVLTILLVSLSLYKICSGDLDGNFETLAVVTTGFVWTNIIFFLRSTFLPFAVFVSGIIKIICDLVPFLMVSLFVLLMFGEMYVLDGMAHGGCTMQGSDSTTDFCTVGNSLIKTYELFVGGIDVGDYADTPLMKTVSILFGFLVSIILLNVVIAIVSNSWNSVMEESKKVFWQHRVEFLVSVMGYQKILNLLCCHDHDSVHVNSKLQRLLQGMDDLLSKICKPFWPSSTYWGSFDTMLERMVNKDVGSFRWQIIYECSKNDRVKENVSNNTWIVIKGTILLVIFYFLAAIWFVAGLATFGLLWPRPMRWFVFGQKQESEHIAISSNTPSKMKPSIPKRLHYIQHEIEKLLEQFPEIDE